MTYNPNQYMNYERGRGSIYSAPPKAKSSNANEEAAKSMGSVGIGGLGGKTTTSSAQKIQDMFKESRERRRDKAKSSTPVGLGTPTVTEPEEDDRNLDQKIYDMIKSFGGNLDPDPEPVYPMEVYESYMFRIPDPVEVTQQTLADPFDAYNVDTYNLGGYNDTRDTAPYMSQTEDPDLQDPRRGLMRPPTMTQPQTNIPEPLMGVDRGVTKANALPTAKYRVQKGDTLSEIAAATGSSVTELAALNLIADVDLIEEGRDLEIPIRTQQDKEVVTKAKNMEDLKPIKASYAMVNALQMPKPKVNTVEGFTDDDLGIPTGPVPDYMFMTPGSKFTEALKAKEADNYDTMFGNAELFDTPFKGIKVSDMSMEEIYEFTKPGGVFNKYNKDKYNKNTTAVGKYQTVGSTLRDLKNRGVLLKLGITDNTKFDKKTQDDIASYLAVHRIKDRATKGDGNIATRGQARREMRNEWEGFKKLSDKELDAIIDDIAKEVGVNIVETKPSTSLRPKLRPSGIMTSPRPQPRPENL